MDKMTWHQYEEMIAQQNRKNLKESKALLDAIKNDIETTVMSYEDYPEIYDYVMKCFPKSNPLLKDFLIYKNTDTAFQRELGIPSKVQGLFMVKIHAILIFHSIFEEDVVLVHEMLHCAHKISFNRIVGTKYEEDIAYGKSVPYLVSKGYSREWIREEYMMSHYVQVELDKMRIKGTPTRTQIDAAVKKARKRIDHLIDINLSGEYFQVVEDKEDTEDDFDVFSFL